MKKWGKANLKQPAVPLFMNHNGMSHPKIQIKSYNVWQKLQLLLNKPVANLEIFVKKL